MIGWNGSNALDFHIACYLGRVIEKSPGLYCIVLSKNKGFDPLIRSLSKSGLKCKRINCLTEREPRIAVTEPSNYRLVQTDIDRIIDLLFVNKMISETNNVVIYSF